MEPTRGEKKEDEEEGAEDKEGDRVRDRKETIYFKQLADRHVGNSVKN